MKKFLLLLLVFPFFVYAQRRGRSSNEHPFTENKTAISFNPFALAEIDFTALAGYENMLAPKLYLSNEAGFIFASNYIGRDERSSNSGTGFLIRPSVKWFVADNNKFYLQPQMFYKQVTHKMNDWLGKAAVNGVPSYEQLQDFKYRRKIFGFNAVAGYVLGIDKYKKSYVDLYAGIGIRYKKAVIVGEPHSIYQNPSGVFGNMDNGTYPSVPFGVRFIFAIN